MMPFLATMLGLLIAGLWRGKAREVGTVAILLVNWLSQVGAIRLTGEQFPWLLFIVTDYLSALAIFAVAARRWGSAIIAIYIVQILCHFAFGRSAQGRIEEYTYYWALTYTGWGQLLVVGGWLGHGIVGRRAGARSRVSPDRASDREMGNTQDEAQGS